MHLQGLKDGQAPLQALYDLRARHLNQLNHSTVWNIAFHIAKCTPISLALPSNRADTGNVAGLLFFPSRRSTHDPSIGSLILRICCGCRGLGLRQVLRLKHIADTISFCRTIRFVAPFSASTPSDIISRIVAKELSENEGWRVIVENRPGGVTTIAAGDVLSRPADGLSIYAMSVPSVAAPALVPNIPYRLETDFGPVIKASVSYNVLVVNPSVPAHSVAELVALPEKPARQASHSHPVALGPPAHLIGEQFKLQTGVRAQHVPYLQQFPSGNRRLAQWH